MKKLILVTLLLLYSCSKEKDSLCDSCIDESLIDITYACIEIADPVCGCDGITYENYCVATTYSGVKSFTQGACD